jgi:hypothetical protein
VSLRLIYQCRQLRTLERDRCALRVVLIVGIRACRRFDRLLKAAPQPLQLDKDASALCLQAR